MATGRSPSFAEGGLTTVGGAATPGPMRAQWSVVWDASVCRRRSNIDQVYRLNFDQGR